MLMQTGVYEFEFELKEARSWTSEFEVGAPTETGEERGPLCSKLDLEVRVYAVLCAPGSRSRRSGWLPAAARTLRVAGGSSLGPMYVYIYIYIYTYMYFFMYLGPLRARCARLATATAGDR